MTPRYRVSADTRIGINLPSLGPAGRAGVVFVDAMKQATPWYSADPLMLDQNGNVKFLNPGQVAETYIYARDSYLAGNYTLLYDGNGVFEVAPQSGRILSQAPGRIIIQVAPNLGYGIHIRLRGVNPADYPRNIRLILPGFEETYATQPFYPPFVQQFSLFHVLRFKNWMLGDTLATPIVWSLRSTPYSFTQAGSNGVALEYMIALANITGADPWFTIPVGSTDYYVENLSGLVARQLDPRLKPAFEYGDHVWRAGTPANTYALIAARNTHLRGALEWYSARSVQIFNIIARTMRLTNVKPVFVLSGPDQSTQASAIVAREVLQDANAARFADAYAVDGPEAASAVELARENRLQLFASDDEELETHPGGISLEPSLLRRWYSDRLERWHRLGGALFVGAPAVGGLSTSAALGMVDYSVRHPMPRNIPQRIQFNPGVPSEREEQRPTSWPTRAPSMFFGHIVVNSRPREMRSRLETSHIKVAGTAGVPVYINCGGGATGNFVADTDFSGGSSYVVTAPINTSGVTNPAPQAVYDSERYGNNFTYTLTGLTPNGSYTLRLDFAEIYWTSAGQRLFNVSVNNFQVLTNFDIEKIANAPDKAVAESLAVVASSDGKISITFSAVKSTAAIAGIELQGSSGAATPADINAGGGAVGSFAADTAYSGGSSFVVTAPIDTSGVINPAPQSVYDSERYDYNFTYTLGGLTPNGSYTLRLDFAEIYWSSPGRRLFDVYINSVQVLTNFDMEKTAGAPNKAVAETFSVTATSAGQIVIEFTAIRSTATLAGIELSPGSTATPPPPDILTFHGDNSRTGWNSQEALLNTTNVASDFGLLQTLQVDGDVLAQPLFVGQYQVPLMGTHNLLIVATEHNSVYAFDADSLQQIWHVNLGTSQNWSDVGCHDIYPEYGITSTPVIARTGPGSGTIYVVAATEPTIKNFHTRLHALDIGTGADQQTPVEISPTATLTNGSKIAFDPKNQMNRTSLVWANNSLYVGIGSHCDNSLSSITGWLLRYSSALQLLSQFNTVDDSSGLELASIWMSGYAAAVDASGNLFFVTGNGEYDGNVGGKNWGQSALKVSADLSTVESYFTPDNYSNLNAQDLDFGSGGVMLLPGSNDMVARGKDGLIFLLSASSLGGLKSGNAGALQVYSGDTNGTWGGPAYFKGPGGTQYVYYQGDTEPLHAFVFNGKQLSLSSVAPDSGGYGGSSPVTSSNGSQALTGILWVAQRGPSVTLEAYDATNVARLLFSATAGTWSNSDNNPFVSPLVVDGRVFVGATNTVSVFGLLH